MLGYFAHFVLQAQAEYLFQLLCNIFLHTLLETDIFVSWDTKHILLLGPFIKYSLLYLKPDVHSTCLKSIVVTCSNIQWLWRPEDRRSLQTILLWLPSSFNFLSLLTSHLDTDDFALRLSSAEGSRTDAWMYRLPPPTMVRCGIQTHSTCH